MKRHRLQLERKKRNLTQEAAARAIGISAIYLRKLESGLENPGRDTMIAISVYYGVPSEDLFPDLFCAAYDRNPNVSRKGSITRDTIANHSAQ